MGQILIIIGMNVIAAVAVILIIYKVSQFGQEKGITWSRGKATVPFSPWNDNADPKVVEDVIRKEIHKGSDMILDDFKIVNNLFFDSSYTARRPDGSDPTNEIRNRHFKYMDRIWMDDLHNNVKIIIPPGEYRK